MEEILGAKVPGLEHVLGLAPRAPLPLEREVLDLGLPGIVPRIPALPPGLVLAAPGQPARLLVVPLVHPLLHQLRPLGQGGVAGGPGPHLAAPGAPCVCAAPAAALGAVRRVLLDLGTHPQRLEAGADADGAGVGVVGVPLLGEGRVVLHGAARAEGAAPAGALGADGVGVAADEGPNLALPLVQPAAAVLAARAAQPHLLVGSLREVGRLVGAVLGRVPQLLDVVVVRVCQGFSAELVKA